MHVEAIRIGAKNVCTDSPVGRTILPRNRIHRSAGWPGDGAAFAALPFDHLIYTGGTKIGAAIMGAAAKNLTPVTLELGGKSPVLVGRTADIGDVARRVMKAKTFNAGEICLAPD